MDTNFLKFNNMAKTIKTPKKLKYYEIAKGTKPINRPKK